MTPQEKSLLQGLVGRVQGTQLANKDQEAEQFIRQSLYTNPDALYILCQTVLVQQYALEQAQKQLAEARQQLDAQRQQGSSAQPEHHTSFLGKLFGAGDDTPPARPNTSSQPQYAPVPYGGAQPQQGYPAPSQVYGQPQYMPAQSPGMFGGGFGGGVGGGGFLQGAMQTAAGVAAGELAFRGIEDLMHGFGHEAGYGSDRAMAGLDDRSNFSGNDSSSRDDGDNFGNRLGSADGDSGGLSSDIEDRRGDSGRGFFGGGDAGSNGADGFADTDGGSNSDAGSSDDGGSFDSPDDGGGSSSGDDGGF